MKCKECKHYWPETWRYHDQQAVREAWCGFYNVAIDVIKMDDCKYFEHKRKVFDKIGALLAKYSRVR